MILNNQNLMLLTQFAIKAKPLIGPVKVTEMINNERYTFDVLTKAVLTGEIELVEITKKVSNKRGVDFNLINAIASYIYNINDINSNESFIRKSKNLLGKFAKHLFGIKINGASYRIAVEGFLLNVDSKDKTFAINLARKFYRYWKASNRQNNIVIKSDDSTLNNQKIALIKLRDNIDTEFFSHLEICLLTQYTEYLYKKGLPEKDIVLISRIAKLITIELRNEKTRSDTTYRAAVDKTLVLFKNEEIEKLFLVVSREFYYLWLGIIPKTLIAV